MTDFPYLSVLEFWISLFDELDFLPSLNWIFVDYTGNKNQVQTRGHSTTMWTEFCHFLTPPLPCLDSFYTLSVDKNRIFFVHVVIEWPPRQGDLYL